MSNTPRLALPFLAPGQAQKEFFHNESLQQLDSLVAAAVEATGQDAPPATPAPGDCYIIGAAPSGAWAGKAGQLASYSAGGWRFLPPVEGLRALVKSSGLSAEYRGGAWEYGVVRASSVMIGGIEVLSTRSAAIPSPSGGATVDSEARIAVDAMLAALRHHGLIDS